MSTEQLARELDIDNRVDRGFQWFLANVPREKRALVEIDDIDMNDTSGDVLAYAYEDDSEDVRRALGMSDAEAAFFGMWHVTAKGKTWNDLSGEEEEQVAKEYELLTLAWQERLRAHASRAPAEAFEAWAAEKFGALAALDQYSYKDLRAAFEAGFQAA